ncbi:MAG: PAS-domain containing protein [Afipia sp.]|nr:PAS-domain containing protein [Afipia sp.]
MTANSFDRTSASLRIRLLAIIAILLVPLAILQTVELVRVKDGRTRITQDRAYELAKAGASRYQDTIDDVRSVLDILSRVAQVTNGTPESCAAFLASVKRSHAWARSFSVVNDQQRIVCSMNPKALGFDLAGRAWFQKARTQGDFSVSDFFISQLNGAPSTFAAQFYRDSRTDTQQAIIANLDLDWFNRLATQIGGVRDDTLILLMDGNGVVLARFPALGEAGTYPRVPASFLSEVLAHKEKGVFSGLDPEGRERLFGAFPLSGANAHVVVGFDRQATLGAIDRFTIIAAVVFSAVTLIGGLVVWVIGHQIFIRPIERLSGLLRNTLDNMDQGLIGTDRDGRCVITNKRALELLDLPYEFMESRPHKTEMIEYMRKRGEYEGDSSKDYENALSRNTYIYERVRPTGTVLEIRTVSTPDGGRVRTFSDITARRAVELELRNEKERAEIAVQTTRDFLANMSHELRTPLTSIIGISELLLTNAQPAEGRAHFIEMQREAGQGLLSIINDILDYSKIEADELDLEVIPFSLSDLARGCVNLVSEQAERKGIQVVYNVPHDLDLWFLGDQIRLRQVLLNLLSNGVKFTSQGSVTLRIDRVVDTPKVLRFSVSDTGIGIEQSAISKLFDRFVQADSSTTRKYGGTGLGLAISKRLIELMGSQIEVSSKVGAGSTFSFTLSLPSCSAPATQQQSEAVEKNCYGLLLAEDNEISREVIRAMLEQAGHRVTTASNGIEAVAAARHKLFDAILMDLQMPEMDGYEATRKIRGGTLERSDLPIIALTANLIPQEAERCSAAGMDGYVTKPVSWNRLQAEIDRLVSRRRNEKADNARWTGILELYSNPEVESCFLNFETVAQLRSMIGTANFKKLLKLFAVEAEQRFGLSHLTPVDCLDIASEAHSFGGSAGMLGFENLSNACLALYTSATTNSNVEQALRDCRELRDEALAKVAELLEESGSETLAVANS